MNPRTRNLVLLLALVILVGIPFMPIWGSGAEAGNDPSPAQAGAASARGGNPQELPALRLDLLTATRDELPGNGRNIFAGGSSAPAEQSADAGTSAADDESDDSEDTADATPVESVAPVEPNPGFLAGYNYLGMVTTDAGEVATFSYRGLSFYGKVGSVINDTFEIKEITKAYVTIRVLQGDLEQRLRLGAPGADPTGGIQ